MNPRVASLIPKPGHRRLLNFENGETKLFDLTPWLDRGVFRALRDSDDFALAQVVDGSVEWPGDVDLSYDTLYVCSVAVHPAAA